MILRVAPREIADYVERAARVGGCDPSDAELLAASVTFAEIHGGGGVTAFVGLRDATDVSAAIRSIDLAALIVLDFGDTGHEEHELASPAPCELLAMAVDGWRRHGVATDLEGSGLVDRVAARRIEPEERSDDRREEYRRALAEGVGVETDSWAQLTATAAEFLVAESLLDALRD